MEERPYILSKKQWHFIIPKLNFGTVWIFSMAPPDNFFPADPMVKIPNAPGSYNQKEQIKPYPSQQGHQGHLI